MRLAWRAPIVVATGFAAALLCSGPVHAGSISRDIGGDETITADASSATERSVIDLEVRTDDPGPGSNRFRIWTVSVKGPRTRVFGAGEDGQGCSGGGVGKDLSIGTCRVPVPFTRSSFPIFSLVGPLHAATEVFLPRAVPGARANDKTTISTGDKNDIVHGDAAPGALSIGLDAGDDVYLSGLTRDPLPAAVEAELTDENIPAGGVSVGGGPGNDRLTGAVGKTVSTEVLDGGAGNDRITEAEVAFGGVGDDVIRRGERCEGGEGSDSLTDVTIANGGAGSDQITNTDVAGRADGGAGDDTIIAQRTFGIIGGTGNDRISVGRALADSFSRLPPKISGNTGNDSVTLGAEPFATSSVLDGGLGSDFLSFASRTTKVSVTVDGEANDGQNGERLNVIGFDRFRLGSGDDFYFSFIDAGNDQVDGGPGADRILPGDGPDLLIGGTGRDTLNGGAGNDIFQAQDGEQDSITCGSGTDNVTADLADAPNGRITACETVRTSPRGEPMPAEIARRAVRQQGALSLTLRCTRRKPACAGTVAVRGGGASGRAEFTLAAGTSQAVRVPFDGSVAKGVTATLTERGRRGTRRSTTVLRVS